ncbi:hypothetical protein EZS27_001804 [termite gut metagenome]|uniref:Uncharacterized protein n=1 Tax=termite gut metagenome TaxID=433724 RepID=A0A5J4SX68_9ZZZZ
MVGPLGSNRYKNSVVHNADRNSTVDIPVQFYSECIRSYDVTVYCYVSELTLGTDYQIVDEKGIPLPSDTTGAISHPDNITNSKTENYEVRAFTMNYKVTVTIK